MAMYKPGAVYDNVQSIDFDYLKSLGIKGILLDIDNTLIDMYKVMPDGIYEWVQEAKSKGFKVAILSNTNKKEKLGPISEKLQIECISFAKKPAKNGFYRASELLELSINELVMVGDQILTDVWGANRVGMHSIYVKPINKKEYWYTAWKRPIEALILKHYGY